MTMKGLFRRIAITVVITGFLLPTGCGRGRRLMSDDGTYYETGPVVGKGKVCFTLYSTKAKKVNLVGDFNNWSKTADSLYDREKEGLWRICIPLSPGRYEYKFLIDGDKWSPDPANNEAVDDGFGGLNSVITVD